MLIISRCSLHIDIALAILYIVLMTIIHIFTRWVTISVAMRSVGMMEHWTVWSIFMFFFSRLTSSFSNFETNTYKTALAEVLSHWTNSLRTRSFHIKGCKKRDLHKWSRLPLRTSNRTRQIARSCRRKENFQARLPLFKKCAINYGVNAKRIFYDDSWPNLIFDFNCNVYKSITSIIYVLYYYNICNDIWARPLHKMIFVWRNYI